MRPLTRGGLRDSGRGEMASVPSVSEASGEYGGKHRPAPPDDSVSMEDLLLLVKLRQQK